MTSRPADTRRDYAERIPRTRVRIQDHLDDPLDRDHLAALVLSSPFHFHRVFRGTVGEPVEAHVRRLRLERAAAEPKSERRSVTDVAYLPDGAVSDVHPQRPTGATMDAEIFPIEKTTVAFVRHLGPNAKTLGVCYDDGAVRLHRAPYT